MAITYDWTLTNVDISILPDTQEAQLLEIHWGCVARDTETEEYVDAVGSISIAEDNYIFPLATVKNTTKAQVMQWLNNKLGDEKQAIKDNLAGQLAVKSLQDSFVPVD